MLIEGTGFALAIAVYLYLRSLAPDWPIGAPPPDLGPGTAVTLILVASAVPNWLVARWAEARELRQVRIGLVVMSVLGIVPLIVRDLRVSCAQRVTGTATPMARSSGSCSGCTPPTS